MPAPIIAVAGRAAAAAGQATARVGAAAGKQAARVGAKTTKAITKKAGKATAKASRAAGQKASQGARKTGAKARQRAQQQVRKRGQPGKNRRRLRDQLSDGGDDERKNTRRKGKIGRARSLAAAGRHQVRRQGKQAWSGDNKPASYGDADKVAGRLARKGARLAPRLATAPVRSVVNTFRPKMQRKRLRRLLIVALLCLLLLPFCMPLDDEGNLSRGTNAVMLATLICDAMENGGGGTTTGTAGADGTPSVMGEPALSASQLVAWWEDQGQGEPLSQIRMADLIGLYIDEGRSTGVRGDVALAQAIHETGWFRNADSRQRNNFAGIGNTNGRNAGFSYGSPREGVRAHLDLLASYADGSGPGQASTWGEVGNDWSGTDTGAGYWEQVNAHYQSMLEHSGGSSPTVVAASASGATTSPSMPPSSASAATGSLDMERVLRAIRDVETTPEGDYTNQNGYGASGAYQFLPGTWGGYGGYSQAYMAPPEVQDARAREHVQELIAALDGPLDRVISLGWYLGSGDAAPFMDMPLDDPRWDQPRDAFGTTPRQYLERFQQAYDGSLGGGSTTGLAICGDVGATGGGGGPCPVQGAQVDDSANDFGGPRRQGAHQGIDIFADRGTPVLAPASGEVVFGLGNIEGRSYRIYADDGSYYFGAHLDQYVLNGTRTTETPSGRHRVEAGTVIGTVGTTGDAVGTPPHLHWQYHPNGRGTAAIDPQDHFVQLCTGPSGVGAPSGTVVQVSCPAGGSIEVDSSLEANLTSLLAAASGDGINLCGSGYRSPQSQIQLRRQNCGTSQYAIYQMPSGQCSPPTAKPGSSLHEQGLAIDFRNCASRSTACWRWLNGNAARYGLSNLPSEPWHWSTTGR